MRMHISCRHDVFCAVIIFLYLLANPLPSQADTQFSNLENQSGNPNEARVNPLYYVFVDVGSGAGNTAAEDTGPVDYGSGGTNSVYDFGFGYVNHDESSLFKNFGIEISYASLGSFSIAMNGYGTPLTLQGSNTTAFYSSSINTILLPVIYNIKSGDQSSIQLRLGAVYAQISGTYSNLNSVYVNSFTPSENVISSIYGVGYQYNLNENYSLRFKYDVISALGKNYPTVSNGAVLSNPYMATAGIAYSF